MKNNILIYNYDEPLPEQGGIERVTDLLAKELRNAGLNVYILCAKPNRLNKKYQSPGPIYYLPDNNQTIFILNCIKDLEIDVVIDQTEGGIVGPYGYFKKRPIEFTHVSLIAVQHSSRRAVLKNTKNIFGQTGLNSTEKIWASIYNYTVLRIRYLHFLWNARIVHKNLDENYDRTIVLSPTFINDFIHYYPKANRKKVLAIPNPNTYEPKQFSALEKRVIFVGRLKNNPKNVDKLLRIWSVVEQSFPEWNLDIVGDGEDRVAMEQLAKKLELTNVVFHGFQDPSPFYLKASIMCMTSMYEGFPMVLNEAMVHGIVPIVFNSFGAAKDIVDDGVCGFLIKPYDEKEFANKLSLLMDSKDTLSRMSQNAIAHSQLFTRDRIRKIWLSLLDSLASENNKRSH